jgi:DNA-binding response OmpR family regulator
MQQSNSPSADSRLAAVGSRIAYLEDDPAQGEAVQSWLLQAGYAVDWFESGRACALALERGSYDLVLLDWMVPDLLGSAVLQRARQRLREHCPPIIVLSGRDSEDDVVEMLQAGSDDYIVKPPTRAVLLARIATCLRRVNRGDAAPPLLHGRLRVEFAQRRILLDGRVADLSARETDLALHLFNHPGRLHTRAHLANAVWGLPPDADTRTIDVHISNLRRKLDLSPATGWRLVSIYRQGYRLERLPAAAPAT